MIRPKVAYIYLRLSNEDGKVGESGSITNQRKILSDYCERNSIIIAREFVDDNWSGGNFNRPGFQAMIQAVKTHKDPNVNMVITKDLSRLGRDMADSSYYAEQFFPENGIRYVAIHDNFDSDKDNLLSPFQFAMNDMYLRDSAKKVREALHMMMDHGEYCFRAPYGYKKDPLDNHKLIPCEKTAPVVQRIFRMAADGYSSMAIANSLTADGVFPPLKYRVHELEGFNSKNSLTMSDEWNNTTVQRILKNQVYLGDTVLGKSKKVSAKSQVKRKVPEEDWYVTQDTHEPLVTQELFDQASAQLGKRRSDFEQHDRVRRSIFGSVVYCGVCGSSMCSSGTVYKGEREKYWYLTCQRIPKRAKNRCENGARIKYSLLYDLVLKELNSLLTLSDSDKQQLVDQAVRNMEEKTKASDKKKRLSAIKQRIEALEQMTQSVYEDMYAGRLKEKNAHKMLEKFQSEQETLEEEMSLLQAETQPQDIKASYAKFFSILNQYQPLTELTHEIVTAFIDRIEIDPRVYQSDGRVAARSKVPYTQDIRIYYRFIGEIKNEIQQSDR